mgnify:CR=1 FL=1
MHILNVNNTFYEQLRIRFHCHSGPFGPAARRARRQFRGVITENGGQIVNEEAWGLKKLAYPIQKKTTGYYFLFEFTGEGPIVEALETQYRRDERIIRFLTFRQDKYAVEYSEKRRNKLAGKTVEKKEEE